MAQTRAMDRIDERLAVVEPGTLRYEALEVARAFKASWVALGRIVHTIWREKHYKAWGYLTFEAYCGKELGVRRPTAQKLLRSYRFLERHEPALLTHEAAGASTPDLDAVDVLRRAKHDKRIAESQYTQLRDRVLRGDAAAPAARKELRIALDRAREQKDPEAVRRTRRLGMIRRLLGSVRSLRREAASANFLPAPVLARVDDLVRELEHYVPSPS